MDITIYFLKLFFFFYIALLLFQYTIFIFNNCNFYYLYSLYNKLNVDVIIFHTHGFLKDKKCLIIFKYVYGK